MSSFCPACWKEIQEGENTCPHCGADVRSVDQESFDEKLVRALGHTVRETAGMAVWILGERKTVQAVAPLVRLFEMTDDPFLQIEILEALDKIGTEDALNFIMESVEHHIGMVRRRAWEIMEERATREQ